MTCYLTANFKKEIQHYKQLQKEGGALSHSKPMPQSFCNNVSLKRIKIFLVERNFDACVNFIPTFIQFLACDVVCTFGSHIFQS